MKILGIETSCDETAAAVVENGIKIHSNSIFSQINKHKPFGGVVPEIASRNHVIKLPEIVNCALIEAQTDLNQIDAIAVTYGPGLGSSLVVGYSYAKSLSKRLNIPLIGVNHHFGHLYSVLMNTKINDHADFFPMLSLMVSGGDTSIVLMENIREYKVIGTTIDDAAGEALDKAATILGLGYPGGPVIQKISDGGNENFIKFPIGLKNESRGNWSYDYNRNYCFSFSGLKTSLLTKIKKYENQIPNDELKDITASFQRAIVNSLIDRFSNALSEHSVKSFSCSGGVSLNKVLRYELEKLSLKINLPLLLSPPSLCTDNAAMIAGVAYEMIKNNYVLNPIDVSPSLRLKDWKSIKIS
ncbi:MAG: tRNA (adenosine(37)-N6)-threonylcarbamoyltransferase complex transferase subunit TsaD [Verrucomicrobiota bacterium]|nr:tRNA (adenosine(37)-N6)-threonylcarbamoyltransferase complex transferase subunit TsaD [Verrucomicrobiota bacterium]MEC7907723.1 tRNA (adenosine(37)-N6)-threonylcarbamoyltransferase complex transferase subunit TsaD [Verrucomicrobiota bacterium]MEC8753639.1 tRNA (adenosine(37)-N6)-threonylcarbamoyltransferase complex transferase subunit TsaD [Verrucomicrobiota bacterium]